MPNLPNYLNLGVPTISFSGISLQGISAPTYYNPGYRNHTEDFQDIVSWFHGRPSLKFGVLLADAEYGELSASSNLFGSPHMIWIKEGSKVCRNQYGASMLAAPRQGAAPQIRVKLTIAHADNNPANSQCGNRLIAFAAEFVFLRHRHFARPLGPARVAPEVVVEQQEVPCGQGSPPQISAMVFAPAAPPALLGRHPAHQIADAQARCWSASCNTDLI